MVGKLVNSLKNIIALINGHLVVLKHTFKKKVTLQYPEQKSVLNDKFRGELALAVDENSNILCVGCGTCQNVCPAFGAIKIGKAQNDDGKTYVKNFDIDLSKCIFCGNCVYSCPRKAIVMTKNFELANSKKSTLNLDINTLKNNYINDIINK